MNYRTLKISALATLLLLSLGLSPICAQDKNKTPEQDPSVIFDTELVNVPVIVTDGWGRFITGIKKEDFKVSEDGVPQEIENFSDMQTPFSVALLLD
ncbi:MAG TPA: hypothetical protein VEF04_20895, partial [Blastocatellia bacterium]|nr:hypothetical protein [Blastocatellia bacterium]